MYPNEKSVGVAYLLWFFFGFFGIHQFYLGKTGRGVGYLLTLGWLTIGVWIDMFTLASQVRAVNNESQMKALMFKNMASGPVVVNNNPPSNPAV